MASTITIDAGDLEPDGDQLAEARERLAGKDEMERFAFIGAMTVGIDFTNLAGALGLVWELRRLRALLAVDAEMVAATEIEPSFHAEDERSE